MKVCCTTLLLIGLTLPALAGLDKAQVDARISKITTKLEVLQSKPDRRIPPENLRKAKGILLLDRTKAGFVFAYQGGNGLVLMRDPKTGGWTAPAFLKANEGSFGFQLGGQQSFCAILLMNTNAINGLESGNFSFGGEASGTAGNSKAGTEANVSSAEPLTLVYSDTSGLYGGAAVKGGALTPDTDADIAYYGEFLSLQEILQEHKAKPDATAQKLIDKLDQYSKATPQ